MGGCLNKQSSAPRQVPEASYSPTAPEVKDEVVLVAGTSENTKDGYDFRSIHSAVRWNKKPLDEIKGLIPDQEAANLVDPTNGNSPIHIASQNGHIALVHLLISRGADVNAKNKKGNTAFHMALSYDYLECCLALIEAKADLDITNELHHPAKKGLDGDKSLPLLGLLSSKSTADALRALEVIKANMEGISQASFAAAGLKTKKEMKAEWTDEVQTEFKAIFSSFKE